MIYACQNPLAQSSKPFDFAGCAHISSVRCPCQELARSLRLQSGAVWPDLLDALAVQARFAWLPFAFLGLTDRQSMREGYKYIPMDMIMIKSRRHRIRIRKRIRSQRRWIWIHRAVAGCPQDSTGPGGLDGSCNCLLLVRMATGGEGMRCTVFLHSPQCRLDVVSLPDADKRSQWQSSTARIGRLRW